MYNTHMINIRDIIKKRFADRFYSVDQLAEELGVSVQRTRQLLKLHGVEASERVCGLNLYANADVLPLIEAPRRAGRPKIYPEGFKAHHEVARQTNGVASGRPIKWTNGRVIEHIARRVHPTEAYGKGIMLVLATIGQTVDNAWLAKPISLEAAQELFGRLNLKYNTQTRESEAI